MLSHSPRVACLPVIRSAPWQLAHNPLTSALPAASRPPSAYRTALLVVSIGAVNGVAAGAGANLAFACDIVFASSGATFVQSFAKIGVIPDSGGTFLLPRIVGLARATALTMLAEKVSAQQAAEWGMIYKVTEPAALLDTARQTARYLASQPTAGLGLTKRGFNRSLGIDLRGQLDYEEDLQREAGRTSDYEEGVRAFLEKRKPAFTGR